VGSGNHPPLPLTISYIYPNIGTYKIMLHDNSVFNRTTKKTYIIIHTIYNVEKEKKNVPW
jgi:hypothetical protein